VVEDFNSLSFENLKKARSSKNYDS